MKTIDKEAVAKLPISGRIGVWDCLKKQHGRARIDSTLPLLLAGILLIAMTFLENAGAEIIGGMVGGLTVLFATVLWYKFRTFQLHYLDCKESITAEHMREYTALRTGVGRCSFRVMIRPRRGLTLTGYSFAFFDRGKLPWSHGERRNTKDVKVCKMRYFNTHTRDFHDANLKIIDDEGSYTEQPLLSLAAGSRAYFELDVEVSNALESWEGILSFQLHYERDGNPDKKNVRTKFFVRPPNKRRPFRSIFKKVLRCEAKSAQLESNNELQECIPKQI